MNEADRSVTLFGEGFRKMAELADSFLKKGKYLQPTRLDKISFGNKHELWTYTFKAGKIIKLVV